LKHLSNRTFTCLASASVGVATALWGLAEEGWPEWRGIPLQLLGVNGNSTHAVKALAGGLATNAGLGKGEFSAMLNNMRSILHVLGALAMGNW
jgi:hypothetical protein